LGKYRGLCGLAPIVHVNIQPWDKTPPAPRLPDEVIAKTAAKYQEALTRLMACGSPGLA
jgi:hypothetical protein